MYRIRNCSRKEKEKIKLNLKTLDPGHEYWYFDLEKAQICLI